MKGPPSSAGTLTQKEIEKPLSAPELFGVNTFASPQVR